MTQIQEQVQQLAMNLPKRVIRPKIDNKPTFKKAINEYKQNTQELKNGNRKNRYIENTGIDNFRLVTADRLKEMRAKSTEQSEIQFQVNQEHHSDTSSIAQEANSEANLVT